MKRDNFDNTIRKLSWDDIAIRVKRVNPTFYNKLKELSPSNKKYSIYHVTYPYGAEILKNGVLHLPDNQGNMLSIKSAAIPASIKEDLSYNLNSNPVMLILKNNAELFLTANGRHFPYTLLEPGALLGAWGVLDKAFSHPPFSIWELTAGARSLFMLPKISDRVFHERLQRELFITTDVPKSLSDHWTIFRAISNRAKSNDQWTMEVLFFPKNWFYPADNNFCKNIRHFLQEKAWHDSLSLRNRYFADFIFSIIHKQNNLDTGAYFADIIKHLFSIGSGHTVAFEPAVDDSSAPIKLIQDIYVNGGYRLKDYAPIIMTPTLLKKSHKGLPVYFSPAYLTPQELPPKSNNKPSLIADLIKLKNVLEVYKSNIINSSSLDFSKTYFYDLAKNTTFNFYYINPVGDNHILSTETIPTRDPRFKTFQNDPVNTEFSIHNEFIRGCIAVQQET